MVGWHQATKLMHAHQFGSCDTLANGRVSNVFFFFFAFVIWRCVALSDLPQTLTRKWMCLIPCTWFRCNKLAAATVGPWTMDNIFDVCSLLLMHKLRLSGDLLKATTHSTRTWTQQPSKMVLFGARSPKTHFRSLCVVTKWNYYYYWEYYYFAFDDDSHALVAHGIYKKRYILCDSHPITSDAPSSMHSSNAIKRRRKCREWKIESETTKTCNLQSIRRICIAGFRLRTNDTMQFPSLCILCIEDCRRQVMSTAKCGSMANAYKGTAPLPKK